VVYSWIVAHSPAQLCVTSSRRNRRGKTSSRGVSSASGGIVQLPHASNFETHRTPTGARLVVMESPWRQFEPSAIFSSSTSFALDDDCSTKSLQGGRVSVCPLLLHLNATKIGHAQLRSWPRPIGITSVLGYIRLGLRLSCKIIPQAAAVRLVFGVGQPYGQPSICEPPDTNLTKV
jgi:hypothetical protein